MNIVWERVVSEATQKQVTSPVPLTFGCGRMMVNLWISLFALKIVGLQILSQGRHYCIWNVHLWYSKITGNAFAFQYGLNSVSYFNGWDVERSEKKRPDLRSGCEICFRSYWLSLGNLGIVLRANPGSMEKCQYSIIAAIQLAHPPTCSLNHCRTQGDTDVSTWLFSSTHMVQNKAEWAKSIDFYTACKSTIILFSTFTALLVLFVCLYIVQVHLWVSLSLCIVDSMNRTQVLRLGNKLYLFILTHSTLGDLLNNTRIGHYCMRDHLSLY